MNYRRIVVRMDGARRSITTHRASAVVYPKTRREIGPRAHTHMIVSNLIPLISYSVVIVYVPAIIPLDPARSMYAVIFPR
jgi:hypothetical protein